MILAVHDERDKVRGLRMLYEPQHLRFFEDCNGVACDPVGAGLLQADDALAAVPRGNRFGQQR